MSQWGKTLMPLVDELIQSKAVSPINVEQGAMALVSYLQGLILMAKTSNDPKVIQRLGKGALSLLKGL